MREKRERERFYERKRKTDFMRENFYGRILPERRRRR